MSRNTYISKELKCRRHVWIFALSKNSEALSLSVTGRSASQFLLLRPDPDNNDDKALVYKSRRARKFIAHISVSPASYTPTLLWSPTSNYEWKFYLIKTYLIVGLIFWARKFIAHSSVSPASYTPTLLWSPTSNFEWKFYLVKTYLIGLIFWARNHCSQLGLTGFLHSNTTLESRLLLQTNLRSI